MAGRGKENYKHAADRIQDAIANIKKVDWRMYGKMNVQLKADRSNHRTWKAALTLRLTATTPGANGLKLSLMDVLEGTMEKEVYETYQRANVNAYDLVLD